MKDNRGFSLLEVLIIVIVISVVAGFGLSKTEAIFGYNAKEAYKKVVTTLSNGKVQTLSKSQLVSNNTPVKTGSSVTTKVKDDGVYIEIYVKGSNIYSKTYIKGIAENPDGVKIGEKGVVISYKLDDGTTGTLTEEEGHGLMFSYDRSTGAFLPYSGNKYITELTVSGGKRSYVIKLMPKTGKVVKVGKL
ncbi:MAG: prepilin-type N-terminal cleavage/methylation domain-containing protein [Lachnospiraceae bacterium]|nr:prepilin-type N-terminal cleavage/methylation domain-containing protein [Lachnospiraceae bacterium]